MFLIDSYTLCTPIIKHAKEKAREKKRKNAKDASMCNASRYVEAMTDGYEEKIVQGERGKQNTEQEKKENIQSEKERKGKDKSTKRHKGDPVFTAAGARGDAAARRQQRQGRPSRSTPAKTQQ